MKPIYGIEDHSVHLWQVFVPDLLPYINDFRKVLNKAEQERADRFRFDTHRERYIIAHAILRQIISLYSHVPPDDILFKVSKRGKPSLEDRFLLQFNMSHSHDWIVYAFTARVPIGVDIEKMESDFNLKVAKRFLSKDEFEALTALPQTEQVQAFYRLWAGREAIIKATGSGLLTSPPSFSINMFSNSQTIEWTHSDETHHYHLEYFSLDPAYQSAFAATEKITHVVYWAWNANGPVNLL